MPLLIGTIILLVLLIATVTMRIHTDRRRAGTEQPKAAPAEPTPEQLEQYSGVILEEFELPLRAWSYEVREINLIIDPETGLIIRAIQNPKEGGEPRNYFPPGDWDFPRPVPVGLSTDSSSLVL